MGQGVETGQADGAIAQLGERLVCNQKVAGSIPAGSTNYSSQRVMSHAAVHWNLEHNSWHASRVTRVCSLKIRQFVLMSDLKRKLSSWVSHSRTS
jgi:hypothetical protein